MRSSFFEFNVASAGLFTARGNLDTIAHNVANASIPGYSRQYVEQRASRPLTFYNGKGMIGTGSEIYGVAQMRSFYLDKRYWSEMPVLGEYSAKRSQLTVLESLFNEMSTTGLSAQFNSFFDILEDLTTTSNDTTYRTNLLTNATSISTFFRTTYETLKKQQSDINSEIKVIVDQINSLGQQIRTLNEQIGLFELDGSYANDLRDQRARLVDELSGYVNVEVMEVEKNAAYAAGKYPEPEDRGRSQKEFIVMINGSDFVKGVEINRLECKPRNVYDKYDDTLVGLYKNAEDNSDMYDIVWANTGAEFNIYHENLTGQLKGLIDLRDGNSGNIARNLGFQTYDQTTRTLVLDMDPASARVDLAVNGKIKAYDSVTGRVVYYSYKDYTYDPVTKTGTFTLIDSGAENFQDIRFGGANITLSVGDASDYKGIPYYMNKLNELARTFAMAINEGKYMNGNDIKDVTGHVNGYDLYGNQTNKLLFTYRYLDGSQAEYGDAGYNIYSLTAANIEISSKITTDGKLFGASASGVAGESDNRVALSFLNIRSSDKLFLEGNILDFINGMTGELAIDNLQAKNYEKNYTDVSASINNQRTSVSGVNINEEIMNMIRFQQQYQACAKLINIIDGIYDTTINRLGLT